MCIGTIGKIIEINGSTAVCECSGVKIEVSINFVPQIKVGDYCMIHAKTAIAIVDEDEAKQTEELFKELIDITNDGQ